ncbi:MAG: lytic transglycosylase domain-containing protein [Nitrospinota bacterium]
MIFKLFYSLLLFGLLFLIQGSEFSYADAFLVSDDNGRKYFTNKYPTIKNHKVLRRYSLSDKAQSSVLPPIKTTAYEKKSKDKISRRVSDKSKNQKSTLPPNYNRIINIVSSRYQLDPIMLKSIIKVESNFNRYSISRRGAQGLMQLMPETADILEVKRVFDPYENINGGAKYFRQMLDQFKNIELALAAYNAGPNAVIRFQGVPPYKETKGYIVKVMQNYLAYGGLLDESMYKATTSATVYLPKKDSVKPVVYYSFEDESGNVIFTDMPIGKMNIKRIYQ